MSQMMRAVLLASQTTFFSTTLYSAAALPLAMTRERNLSCNCPSAPSRLGLTASNSKFLPSAFKLRFVVVIKPECLTYPCGKKGKFPRAKQDRCGRRIFFRLTFVCDTEGHVCAIEPGVGRG